MISEGMMRVNMEMINVPEMISRTCEGSIETGAVFT
jgi:hypothetical protein